MRSGHGTVRTLGLRGVGLGLSVGSSLIAARLLGAQEFGTYSLLLAWGTVLGLLAVDGLDTLLTRELATSEPSSHRAARRAAGRRAVLPTGLAVLGGLAVAAVQFDPAVSLSLPLIVALVGIVRLQQAVLLVSRRTVGQAGEFLLLPITYGAALVVVQVERASSAAWCYLVACAVVAAAQQLLLSQLPRGALIGDPDTHADWGRSRRDLRVANLATLAQGFLPTFLLGALAPRAEVGVYGVAGRVAGVVALPLNAVSLPLAPDVAAAHARGDRSGLQAVLTSATRHAFLAAGVLAVLVLLALPLVDAGLGPGFPTITATLGVLLVGQLVNVGVGPVAAVLRMTGHERDVRDALLWGIVVSGVVCVALVPGLGALGAAAGSATSLVVWNVLLLLKVRRRLGVAAGPRGPSQRC